MKKGVSIAFFLLILVSLVAISLVLIILFRESNPAVVLSLSLAALVLLIVAIFYVLLRVSMPVSDLERRIKALSRGEFIESNGSLIGNEIGSINEALDLHVKRQEEISGIIHDLAEGEIKSDIKIIGQGDELGKSLIRLNENILSNNKEVERRRKLDEQLNWSSQGLAFFGELLRNFEHDVSKTSNEFIKELVKYLDMEVGGFFLARTSEKDSLVYEMTGAYAFDREKQINRSFLPGEGLVGRCALEMQSIIITDVPEDYIRIRSGMGEDKAAALILVPVLFGNEVLGVIELASFLLPEKYKITFLEDLGKSIANILSKHPR